MMNDLISRRAAIDAWKNDFKGYINALDMPKDDYNGIMEYIDEVPSAQPEPCEGVVSRNAIIQKLNTMDRYVSEELRLCDTDKKFQKNEVFIVDDVYEEIVEQLPSAQSEIVRCKDCENWIPGYITDNDDFIPPKCGKYQQMVGHSSDDYCSHAERKTDG